MQLVQLDKVKIPENRQRRDFDEKKLRELKTSIERIGLLAPIVVEQAGEEFILRAGERRLRVVRELAAAGTAFSYGTSPVAVGHVPAMLYAELTPIQRLEVEVEENVVRADFTWQERARALAALHSLRSAQNTAAPGVTTQTVTATASEVIGKPAEGSQVSMVSEALILAKHLDNPEVAKAATPKEAIKIVRRIAETKHRAKLAEKYDQAAVPHTLTKGDALELLATLPDSSFDVILTDPPYGVGANQFGSQASTGHDYEDSQDYFESFANTLAEETFRVAKPLAHAYVFCDQRRFDRLATLFELAGWRVFPTTLIWDKGNNGMLPLPEHGPRRTYECILYAYKGERKTLCVKADIIRVPPVKQLRHGAQKPVALYLDLLSRSANPGDTVLDPFCGSGTIFVAANAARLTATGFERNENTYNLALSRMGSKESDDATQVDDGISIDLSA